MSSNHVFCLRVPIGVGANFSSGLSQFFDSARKTPMLTYKITFLDSPHSVIISKIPDFGHFISLDGMNSGFLRLMNTKMYIHRVSKKLCQLIFCSLSVKYEPISMKIGRSVPE